MRIVQRNAMKVWEATAKLSLLELLKGDPEVTAALPRASSRSCSTSIITCAAVDAIFDRVFGPAA